MNANDIDAGYSDPSNDKFSQQHLKDTRKPHLTLAHLNKLKKQRAAKDLENLMRGDVLQLIYGAPAEEAAGGI
jgi:hypothetical protein